MGCIFILYLFTLWKMEIVCKRLLFTFLQHTLLCSSFVLGYLLAFWGKLWEIDIYIYLLDKYVLLMNEWKHSSYTYLLNKSWTSSSQIHLLFIDIIFAYQQFWPLKIWDLEVYLFTSGLVSWQAVVSLLRDSVKKVKKKA